MGNCGISYQNRETGIGLFDQQVIPREKTLKPVQNKRSYAFRLMFGIGLFDLPDVPANIVELPGIIRSQAVYTFIRHPGPGVNRSRIEMDKAVISGRWVDRLLLLFSKNFFCLKPKTGS